MDVFELGHSFPEFDSQLHDFNPGISETGVFWTMPVPPDSAAMNLGKGEAAFCLSDAQMPDMGDLLTATWGGGAVDGLGMPLSPVFASTVSVEARWFDGGSKETLEDEVNQFRYVHRVTDARIKWRSIRRGAMFESDEGPQVVDYAAIGKERNGVFFRGDDDHTDDSDSDSWDD